MIQTSRGKCYQTRLKIHTMQTKWCRESMAVWMGQCIVHCKQFVHILYASTFFVQSYVWMYYQLLFRIQNNLIKWIVEWGGVVNLLVRHWPCIVKVQNPMALYKAFKHASRYKTINVTFRPQFYTMATGRRALCHNWGQEVTFVSASPAWTLCTMPLVFILSD